MTSIEPEREPEIPLRTHKSGLHILVDAVHDTPATTEVKNDEGEYDFHQGEGTSPEKEDDIHLAINDNEDQHEGRTTPSHLLFYDMLENYD
ncbi:unnamed protein product [Amoebophrya sp. A25]|nr:unnamed protein product [Amoebophrya sp. A25]|eukprot:GSA25T00017023001.1